MSAVTATNVAMEFGAALLVFSTILGLILLSEKGRKENTRFFFLVLLLGISALSNGVFFLLQGRDGETARTLVTVLTFIRIDAGLWLVAEVNSLVLDLFGESKPWYTTYKKAIRGVMGGMTALLVVNVFTHFLYQFGDGNVCRKNGAFFVVYVVEGLVWCADVVLFFINRKTLPKMVKRAFYISLASVVVTTCLQFAFQGIAFCDVMIAMNIVYLLFGEQIKMREQLAERDEQLLRQRVKLMQRQVSPHFIYNALTAIQMLPGNSDETKGAIGDFAKYLRGSLSAIDEETLIPFKKELENVQAYFRLEKIRFGKSLQVEFDVGETEFSLPAMCVQILAENAVKHGVSVRREGGTVRIATKREGDEIVISVADDGVGFDVTRQMDSSHIGIENVKNRVKTLVGGNLSISSEPGKGTVATIRFPLA